MKIAVRPRAPNWQKQPFVTSDQPCDLNRVFGDFLGRAVTSYTLYVSLHGNPMDSGSGTRSGSGSSFLDNQNPKASFSKPHRGTRACHIASGTFLLEKTSFLVAGLSPAPPGACSRNCPSPYELDTVHLLGWELREEILVCAVLDKTLRDASRLIPVRYLQREIVDTWFELLHWLLYFTYELTCR